MRHLYILLIPILFISCISSPQVNTRQERQDNLAYVSFYNYSIEDIYLYMAERGRPENAIGTMNRNEQGQLRRTDSLIPSGGNMSFIISAGYYTIVPRKSNGQSNTDFNRYEEFYFPPSTEEYTIHLNPQHERITTASIDIQESSRNIRLPSFDIRFRDEMIRPIVEDNIELRGEDNKLLDIEIEWHNNRWLTVRPREALLASALYEVRVGVEARNTETDRITSAVVFPYATGNIISNISSFDPASVKYDTSIPGYIRLDWELPLGAHGSEIHIMGGAIEDLQAKTNYTFVTGNENIEYKILPYRISSNGRKEYNQTDLERPLRGIPQVVLDGALISHTVIANTAGRLEFRINFNNGSYTPNSDISLKNNVSGSSTVLNAGNNFTYRNDYPAYIPEETYSFSLYADDVMIYSFTLKSPTRSEIDTAAERRRIAQRESERLQRQRERQAEWDGFWEDLLEDDRRFWSVGANIGSMYGGFPAIGIGVFGLSVWTDSILVMAVFGIPSLAGGLAVSILSDGLYSPAITLNLNTTIAPFPYSFIELGCDVLFINPKGIEGDDYLSFYPYANYLFFINVDGYDSGGLYFGAGAGRMFTVIGSAERAEDYPDLIHDNFALNAIIGGKIGKNPHYFDIRAIGCFDFNKGFYFTLLLGYSFRLFQ